MKLSNILNSFKRKLFKPVDYRYQILNQKLDLIINKLSLEDNIIDLKDARFWVPHAPRDKIQNTQLLSVQFFEIEILKRLDKYLDGNSVVLDIGANTGNHAVYWGKITKVKKVFAFEPIKSSFQVLKKNIEINNLENKTSCFNLGLGDKTTKGKIKGLYNIQVNTIADSLGSIAISEDKGGDIEIRRLDEISEIFNEETIEFVKIDVEGFEKKVLQGSIKFFKKFKPKVFIECFPNSKNLDFIINYFKVLGYNDYVEFPGYNYLFIYNNLTNK